MEIKDLPGPYKDLGEFAKENDLETVQIINVTKDGLFTKDFPDTGNYILTQCKGCGTVTAVITAEKETHGTFVCPNPDCDEVHVVGHPTIETNTRAVMVSLNPLSI